MLRAGSVRKARWGFLRGLRRGSACRPRPTTISLRKGTPALRSWSTVALRSVTSSENRFQPPGSGIVPSGIACPPPPAPLGALSVRRRSPRESIANVGAGVHHLNESEVASVEVDCCVDVVDDVADANGCHSQFPFVGCRPQSDSSVVSSGSLSSELRRHSGTTSRGASGSWKIFDVGEDRVGEPRGGGDL